MLPRLPSPAPWHFAILTVLGLILPVAALYGEDARPVEDAASIPVQKIANPALPTLFLVGDSTVKVGTSGQRGWGEEIGLFFDRSKINVVNRAIGGRSSRTFQTEGRWEQVLAELKTNDFVLIQFGHNDGGDISKGTRPRASLKGSGDESVVIAIDGKEETVHTFGWYIRKYITDTRARGATPIVCSLIPRKIWTPDGKIVRASESYGKWTADAARATGAAFVDLNEIVAREYEKLGKEKVESFFADEHTHTNAAGARVNAASVIAGLQALKENPLAPYLIPNL
ncbi:MAG: lipolytic protein family [Chthoniobacteraceae bacterium]|nr:lipolytic protein family [Chthoniobacteraceae bacterium]